MVICGHNTDLLWKLLKWCYFFHPVLYYNSFERVVLVSWEKFPHEDKWMNSENSLSDPTVKKKNSGYFLYLIFLKMLKCRQQWGRIKTFFALFYGVYAAWILSLLRYWVPCFPICIQVELDPSETGQLKKKKTTYFFFPLRFNYAHSTLKGVVIMDFDWNVMQEEWEQDAFSRFCDSWCTIKLQSPVYQSVFQLSVFKPCGALATALNFFVTILPVPP